MSIGFVVALSLAAVGCKKGGGDCEKALSHSMEVAKASMPNDEKVRAKLQELGVQHCKDDKWTPEVVQCMIDAKAEPDAQACYGKLTQEQQTKMNKAAMEMMAPPGSSAPPGGAAPAATPPAAGSDTAAPAAGSAAGSDMGSAAAGGSAAPAGSADGSAGSAAAPK